MCFIADDDRAIRPCFLDLYNPNQTPVAVRKSKFNLSLAHNAYELNNLDPEMLDAPNLNCSVYETDADGRRGDEDFPEEPVSMPPLSSARSSNFSHKKPTYQSAHPQVDLGQLRGAIDHHFHLQEAAAAAPAVPVERAPSYCPGPETGISGRGGAGGQDACKWKGVLISAAERDLIDSDAQILNIELNRGWNSRLGFSLQEVDGSTCVTAVYSDSVAAKDGRIKPGDCLLKVRTNFQTEYKHHRILN